MASLRRHCLSGNHGTTEITHLTVDFFEEFGLNVDGVLGSGSSATFVLASSKEDTNDKIAVKKFDLEEDYDDSSEDKEEKFAWKVRN